MTITFDGSFLWLLAALISWTAATLAWITSKAITRYRHRAHAKQATRAITQQNTDWGRY